MKDTDFSGDVSIKWYHDGELNVSANCLDRHLPLRANQVSTWVGGERGGCE